MSNTSKVKIPLIPLRGNITFPEIRTQIEIVRPFSKRAVNFAFESDRTVFFVSQRNPNEDSPKKITDFFETGVLAEVVSVEKGKAGTLKLTFNCVSPATLVEVKESATNTFFCEVEAFSYLPPEGHQAQFLFQAMLDRLAHPHFDKVLDRSFFSEVLKTSDFNNAVNILANTLVLRTRERQEILAERKVETRLELLSAYLVNEIELAEADRRIANRVKMQVQTGQKEYYLREQMKAISKELGEDENEIADYNEKIEKAKMPLEIEKKAKKEVSRLSKMSPTSPDASVIRNYVDWLIDLPWHNETVDNKDLKLARQVLDEDHYGLEKIKERIIEFLAVMQLTGKLNGQILCFVGPPGVGKTSIVKSIARALNRKYLRVSLGGVRDEAEIRGHRRTYVGAIPGKIIYMMKQAGCINPVMLLDEIDKMSKDNRGDPASAMLEVLDPEQNNSFTDHFLEAPYDLSKVLFVCTANATDDIPEPLLDRMEIIELSGYTEFEKIAIADEFLLKKNLEKHGIPIDKVKIDKVTYQKIIECYTRESGVRSLEREIAAICRKVALKLVENPDQKITVSSSNLTEFLGVEKYKDELTEFSDTVGSARGLAWTRVGGTTLNVDATLFAGKGDILLTGKLGDVMKESARTAISLVRSLADKYNIDKEQFGKTDIHIHVPEGAIPKDGPSAGVTMATVILSAFSGKAVKGDIAMTGEITLRGKVLPIGGVKEKVLAAYRVGVKKVILPLENKSDLSEIPTEIKNQMQFVLAETIEAVFDNALV